MKSSTTVSNLSVKLSYIVAAILAMLPFHAFLTTWGSSNTGLIDIWRIWKEILIVSVLLPPVILIALRMPAVRQWLKDSWIVRLIGAYAALHLVMGGWALAAGKVNPEALIYALGINLRYLLFFLICAVIAANSDFLKMHWRKILLLPALLVIVFGLLQKFALPYDFLRHFGYGDNAIPAFQTVDNDLDHRRIQSFLRGANPLGAYLILIIPALILGFKRSKLPAWLITAAAVTVLFFSYSRSAWLGTLTACLLLAAVMTKRTHSLKWLFALTAASVIFIGGLSYTLRENDTAQNVLFHTSEDSTSSQSSNSARLQSLENGANDIIDEPLGRGPGTAGPASFRNDETARISENYFLQIGQEIGVLGMGILVAINTLIASRLWQQRRERLSLLLLVSLAGLTLVNLISHAWTDDTISLLWWGLAGVALAPVILKANTSSKKNV